MQSLWTLCRVEYQLIITAGNLVDAFMDKMNKFKYKRAADELAKQTCLAKKTVIFHAQISSRGSTDPFL